MSYVGHTGIVSLGTAGQTFANEAEKAKGYTRAVGEQPDSNNPLFPVAATDTYSFIVHLLEEQVSEVVSITVDWGDSSANDVLNTNIQVVNQFQHVYAMPGNYTPVATISFSDGSSLPVSPNPVLVTGIAQTDEPEISIAITPDTMTTPILAGGNVTSTVTINPAAMLAQITSVTFVSTEGANHTLNPPFVSPVVQNVTFSMEGGYYLTTTINYSDGSKIEQMDHVAVSPIASNANAQIVPGNPTPPGNMTDPSPRGNVTVPITVDASLLPFLTRIDVDPGDGRPIIVMNGPFTSPIDIIVDYSATDVLLSPLTQTRTYTFSDNSQHQQTTLIHIESAADDANKKIPPTLPDGGSVGSPLPRDVINTEIDLGTPPNDVPSSNIQSITVDPGDGRPPITINPPYTNPLQIPVDYINTATGQYRQSIDINFTDGTTVNRQRTLHIATQAEVAAPIFTFVGLDATENVNETVQHVVSVTLSSIPANFVRLEIQFDTDAIETFPAGAITAGAANITGKTYFTPGTQAIRGQAFFADGTSIVRNTVLTVNDKLAGIPSIDSSTFDATPNLVNASAYLDAINTAVGPNLFQPQWLNIGLIGQIEQAVQNLAFVYEDIPSDVAAAAATTDNPYDFSGSPNKDFIAARRGEIEIGVAAWISVNKNNPTELAKLRSSTWPENLYREGVWTWTHPGTHAGISDFRQQTTYVGFDGALIIAGGNHTTSVTYTAVPANIDRLEIVWQTKAGINFNNAIVTAAPNVPHTVTDNLAAIGNYTLTATTYFTDGSTLVKTGAIDAVSGTVVFPVVATEDMFQVHSIALPDGETLTVDISVDKFPASTDITVHEINVNDIILSSRTEPIFSWIGSRNVEITTRNTLGWRIRAPRSSTAAMVHVSGPFTDLSDATHFIFEGDSSATSSVVRFDGATTFQFANTSTSGGGNIPFIENLKFGPP